VKRLKISLIFILFSTFIVACQSDEVVNFSDQHFEEAVRTELNQSEGELKESDVNDVIELDLAEAKIEDISGIEAFVSLKKVNLENNQIEDVSPLRELNDIEYVNLIGNNLDKKQHQRLKFLWDDGVKVLTMKEADGPGGFLWEVKHGNTTVYLQGTIHAGPRDFYPMNDEIESIYKEADVIVPEIHPKDISTQSMMTLYDELGTYQDGTTIEDHIPADLYDDVSSFLNDHGLPSELEHYKPWLLSNLISSLIMQEAGYIHGVDDYFLSRAQNDDKEITALETAEEQLAIFADTSEDFQVELLKSSIEEMDHYEENMLEMFSLYTDGDLEKMLEYTTTDDDSEMSKEEQTFMNALNDERNNNMSDQIIDYLDSGEDITYLVIVGSLHLIEEPSVISILEDEGYDVKHIR